MWENNNVTGSASVTITDDLRYHHNAKIHNEKINSEIKLIPDQAVNEIALECLDLRTCRLLRMINLLTNFVF